MIYNFVTDFIIETVFAFPFSKYDDITTFTTFNTTLSVFIMYLHKTLVWVNDIGPFEKMTVVRSKNYVIKMGLVKKKYWKQTECKYFYQGNFADLKFIFV